MEQINLRIVPRLSYSPDNFVMHSGMRSIHDSALTLASAGRFALVYIHGHPRSGKTHLTIRIAEQLIARGLFPRIVEGADFSKWLRQTRSAPANSAAQEVLLVDDADMYLTALQPGESGPFVDFVEELRVAQRALLLTGTAAYENFPGDDHLMSRLRAGTRLAIANPQEDEMTAIVASMARQRGLALAARSIEFLARRLRREIGQIEGYLDRVLYLSQVAGRPLTQALLADAL